MTAPGFGGPDPSQPERLGEVLARLKMAIRYPVRVDAGADEEGNLTLQCTCGCGELNEVTLPNWPNASLPAEIAYTCTGCGVSHWLAVS